MASDFQLRPQPDERQRERMAAGKSPGVCDPEWFERGALVVDAEGFAVLDADGERHELPVPPEGKLVWLALRDTANPGMRDTMELFVADRNGHRVARITNAGFGEAGVAAVAQAAGLTFEHPRLSVTESASRYPQNRQVANFYDVKRVQQKGRHGLRGLFGRSGAADDA